MAALQQLRFASAVSSLFPRTSGPAFASSFRSVVLFTHARPSSSPSWPSLAVAIPAAIQTIPGILGDIWEGILKAVPKSKTSHMKKRHRQMAGKALKDVTNLNKCPACGAIKKQHTLCTQCMGSKLGPGSCAPPDLSLTASQKSRACSPTHRRNPTSTCECNPSCESALLYQNHRNITSDRRWGPEATEAASSDWEVRSGSAQSVTKSYTMSCITTLSRLQSEQLRAVLSLFGAAVGRACSAVRRCGCRCSTFFS